MYFTAFIRKGNETMRHDLVSVRTLAMWFPEIDVKFFENFNVESINFTFEKDGNISHWGIYRNK